MIEWLSDNWESVLGTGGIGVIVAALITGLLKVNNKSGSKNIQKQKTGNNSISYQVLGDITVNNQEDNT